MKDKNKKILLIICSLFIFFIFVCSVFIITKQASHNKEWEFGQEKLPFIQISGNDVIIKNYRDFLWHEKTEDAQRNYIQKQFLLSDIEGVDVVISHFSPYESLAHVFLNFNLSNGDVIGISVEARRETHEEFSPLMGLLSNFELIYIVASYFDLVGLRQDIRNESVYVYPTIASKEKTKELFLSLASDINDLYEKPRFYNTFSSNCTNILARSVEKLSDYDFPWYYTIFAPGKLDKALFEMKVIQTEDTLEKTREKYLL